jgi:hypothetical protein
MPFPKIPGANSTHPEKEGNVIFPRTLIVAPIIPLDYCQFPSRPRMRFYLFAIRYLPDRQAQASKSVPQLAGHVLDGLLHVLMKSAQPLLRRLPFAVWNVSRLAKRRSWTTIQLSYFKQQLDLRKRPLIQGCLSSVDRLCVFAWPFRHALASRVTSSSTALEPTVKCYDRRTLQAPLASSMRFSSNSIDLHRSFCN